MTDEEYLELAAEVLEECIRILKRHNEEEANGRSNSLVRDPDSLSGRVGGAGRDS